MLCHGRVIFLLRVNCILNNIDFECKHISGNLLECNGDSGMHSSETLLGLMGYGDAYYVKKLNK